MVLGAGRFEHVPLGRLAVHLELADPFRDGVGWDQESSLALQGVLLDPVLDLLEQVLFLVVIFEICVVVFARVVICGPVFGGQGRVGSGAVLEVSELDWPRLFPQSGRILGLWVDVGPDPGMAGLKCLVPGVPVFESPQPDGFLFGCHCWMDGWP